MMIRVVLPAHLKTLSGAQGEVTLEVNGKASVTTILDALEKKFPMLEGTIRDHETLKRRPMVRFFVCQEDISLEPPDKPLPSEVTAGKEPFLIIGSIAGG
jgi:molybdopterin synthase sulfur carrier subunit